MKKFSQLLSLFVLAVMLASVSGCVQNQPRHYVRSNRLVPRSPYIGSPEWITWVDHKVDTRYSNGIRPDAGSQEWYAIVDHVVFADYSNDYYRNIYRDQYRKEYQRDMRTRDGRYADHDYRGDRKTYRLGSIEWKRAVDAEILSGRVPPPPPRSDPWDAPLAPTH